MDISDLQTFIAVAETGSFSQASEQLFLTQPAISKRIAGMEEELGASLFDRIGRKVGLTEAGQSLLPRARSILLEVEDSRRAISNLSGRIAGKLRIGTSHHIGLHRLPPILKTFIQRYPDVELDIQFMDSEEACRSVEHGDLELGIVTLPLQPVSNLTTKLIWPDPLSLVISHQHPLKKCKQITLEQLAEHPAILPSHGTYTREVIEEAFEPSGLKLKIGMSTNYLETLKMLVMVGLGWSVIPNTMLSKELQAIRISEISLRRELGMVWHQGRTLSNAARTLTDIIEHI